MRAPTEEPSILALSDAAAETVSEIGRDWSEISRETVPGVLDVWAVDVRICIRTKLQQRCVHQGRRCGAMEKRNAVGVSNDKLAPCSLHS